MAAQRTITGTVTKHGGGQSVRVTVPEGADAGTAVLRAGFGDDLERCSITVNDRHGDRETKLKNEFSVQLASPVANG